MNLLFTVFPHIVAVATILFWIHKSLKISHTVFPHIIAVATIFFEFIKAWKFHIVSSFSFLLCNENLNSFLTIWGNTVFYFSVLLIYESYVSTYLREHNLLNKKWPRFIKLMFSEICDMIRGQNKKLVGMVLEM